MSHIIGSNFSSFSHSNNEQIRLWKQNKKNKTCFGSKIINLIFEVLIKFNFMHSFQMKNKRNLLVSRVQ